MTRAQLFPFALGALAIFISGCGGNANVVPVTGVVTIDDKPVAGASVSFQPRANEGKAGVGVGSYATTDEEGRFRLKLVHNDQQGAVVGPHSVRISQWFSKGDGDADGGREMIPQRYNAKSTLTFEVPAGGSDKAEFALKSDKRR